MSRTKKIVVLMLLIVSFALGFSGKIFFPSDVVNNIPSFSEQGWERPQNSLLADPVYQFEPWRDFAKRELKKGRFPLWNDMNSSGVPLFANSQSAVLFPLHFLYYIFPPNISLLLIPLGKIGILFFGSYVYLREIKISKGISSIGAGVITFAAFPMTWLLWPHTNVYIFLPLLLFLTEKIKNTTKGEYKYFIIISIVYLCMILGGHPETLFLNTILHSIYIFSRFFIDIKEYVKFLSAIFLGYVLGAIQILPFLEYLQHSYAIIERSGLQNERSLPLESLAYNIFPYVLGAPQGEVYRPIIPATNFQEVTGGYVGLIVLVLGVYAALSIKNFYTKFWGLTALVSALIAYNIWPISLFLSLPIVRVNAHQRVIAFLGLSLAILFVIYLRNSLKSRRENNIIKIPNYVWILVTILVSICYIASFYVDTGNWRLQQYVATIRTSFLFVVLSSLYFIGAYKIKKSFFLLTVGICVLLQSIGLFYNYNPLLRSEKFYPQTTVTQILEKLPQGNYIEVGNPALPPNINMKYDLYNIQNYDAVDIKIFKNEFDRQFPDKNSWGNPDSIKRQSVDRFDIKYILSDYDINLSKQSINSTDNRVISLSDKKLSTKFTPVGEVLKELRLKPATFNRQNNCTVLVEISSKNQKIFQKYIMCSELRNNMFYTSRIPSITLRTNEEYVFSLSTSAKKGDQIGFYGSSSDPFLELLFEKNEKEKYTLITKSPSTYIFSTTNRTFDEIKKHMVYDGRTTKIFDIDSQVKKEITLPIAYYPGWNVMINDSKANIFPKNGYTTVVVEQGKNYIVATYRPQSFIIGLSISLLALASMVIFITRKERKKITIFVISLRNQVKFMLQKVNINEQIIATGIGASLAIIIFSWIAKYIHIKNPYTTAINWITVNNYPKLTDYFYFLGFFFAILLGCSVGLFVFYIWKKIK